MTPPSLPADVRAALAAAYAATPAEYRSFFGVTTTWAKGGTAFWWTNSFTGERGRLASVKPGDLTDVTLALLDEMKTLRAPARKEAQNETTMRRRKTA